MAIPAVSWGLVVVMVAYVFLSYFVRGRVKTLEDYWVMGRKAKWYLFAGTLCASYVSMWTFVAGVGLAWSWGPTAPMLFYTSSITFGWIIATILIGLRLRKLGYMTITDFYQDRFGGGRGLISSVGLALTGTLYFYLLIQIQGGAIILSTLFPINMVGSVIIMICLVGITLWLSGMWSVVVTDAFTMFIFVAVAILVLPVTVKSVGGLNAGIEAISANNHWSAIGGSGLDMGYFVGYALAWLAIIGGSPHLINRTLIVEEEKSVFKGTFVAYAITIILSFALFLSGGMLAGIIPAGSMTGDEITPFAALNIWPLFLGLLILVGAMAAAFTTANTQVITMSQGIVDLFRLLKKDSPTDKQLMLLAKIFSVLILVCVAFLAVSRLWIMAIASSLAGIIASLGFFPTILLSLYWKRITRTAATIMLWASIPIGLFMIIMNYFYQWFAPFPTIYSYPIGFGGLIILSLLTKQSPQECTAAERVSKIAFSPTVLKKDKSDKRYIYSTLIIVTIVLFLFLYVIGVF